jgi:hypothetical protein
MPSRVKANWWGLVPFYVQGKTSKRRPSGQQTAASGGVPRMQVTSQAAHLQQADRSVLQITEISCHFLPTRTLLGSAGLRYWPPVGVRTGLGWLCSPNGGPRTIQLILGI